MLMAFFGEPWEYDDSRDGGYLAGIFDGEGSLGKTVLQFAQNPGPTLDRVKSLLEARGFNFTLLNNSSTSQVLVLKAMRETLRFMGMVRPPRLMAKARQVWENRCTWGKRTPIAEVISIEPLDDGEVVAIKTDTATYISDGFFSHNCAIEAVIVGYEARSWDYVRLAKLGIHDYLNSHILHRQGKIDRPADTTWPDADLRAFFKDLKKRFKEERDVSKRIVHGSNYMMTPRRMWELYPEQFPTLKTAASLQSLYFEVCPAVQKWQHQTIEVTDNGACLRNPYG
jgi:hypothetical protein